MGPGQTPWGDMALTRYILIKESLTPGHAVLAGVHASLGGYLTCVKAEKETLAPGVKTVTEQWADTSFRERVCKVTDAEFEQAKGHGTNMVDYQVMTESSLGGAETAIVFAPREEWAKFFKFLKLYR